MGGPAKSHLIRELDALGGEIGKATDACSIQMRRLNTSKGPAVQSLRAQVDRVLYLRYMKNILEQEANLSLKQALVEDLIIENQEIRGVITELGLTYKAPKVILATGTFLMGKIIIGDYTENSGPDGLKPSVRLSQCLQRLHCQYEDSKPELCESSWSSLDFDKMIEQPPEEIPLRFGFDSPTLLCL
jgi:tRNA uridine 5-carboxymethylaminomethyl modification enzyme